MPVQGSLSVERMCRVAAVSRASFYRWLEPVAPVEEEMEVRSAIQAVVLEHRRRYGYRRVTVELRRRGLCVNHKRVARLMGEDNLLAVQPRAWVATTNSGHELEVYMNLAVRMKITGINQLWVAVDKDEGIVKHKNPVRCVSTASLARGVADQNSGRFTLHQLAAGV